MSEHQLGRGRDDQTDREWNLSEGVGPSGLPEVRMHQRRLREEEAQRQQEQTANLHSPCPITDDA